MGHVFPSGKKDGGTFPMYAHIVLDYENSGFTSAEEAEAFLNGHGIDLDHPLIGVSSEQLRMGRRDRRMMARAVEGSLRSVYKNSGLPAFLDEKEHKLDIKGLCELNPDNADNKQLQTVLTQHDFTNNNDPKKAVANKEVVRLDDHRSSPFPTQCVAPPPRLASPPAHPHPHPLLV